MPTCSENERDVTVAVWPSALGDDAIVVQVDTGSRTGRLRVNVNDAPVFDKNPEAPDERPVAGIASFDVVGASRILPDVSDAVAAHVLNFFGQGGYEAGSNRTHIMHAFATADTETFRLLSTVFPDYAACFVYARTSDEGISVLTHIAAGTWQED